MCFLKRKPARPPTRPPRVPRFRKSMEQNQASSSLSLESEQISSSDFSGISTGSTSSVAGIREMLSEGPIVYRFGEILKATDNFSSRKLGNSLWKGNLRNTTVVIAKKQGYAASFREVLSSIGLVHHSNLVALLGGCCDGGHAYLIYEFVEGANLRELIRSSRVPGYSPLSTWKSRLQIALDVAKGLEYLHHRAIPGFIHKYIQSTKILVNNNRRAKITEFGVAQLTGEVDIGIPDINPESVKAAKSSVEIQEVNESKLFRSDSLKITGTQGYMAPEYLISGIITPKYDVFAFGVVLLELLSGQEAVVKSEASRNLGKKVTLPETVEAVMDDPNSKDKLRQWMDPLLRGSYPIDEAYKVATLARSCVNVDPHKRPEMQAVALKLSKFLTASEKWEAMFCAGGTMSTTLQPR
eukprot:c22469_g1_i1 orf=553-1785(+)